MVFNLKSLVEKYDMNIKDIIHVGGHFGQEVPLYREINPSCVIQIFEPHPETFKILQNNVSGIVNIECYNIALGPKKSVMRMYCETNNAPLYKNCCMIGELDQFLSTYGFSRVETDWIGETWGDAFYIKNDFEC